VFVGCLLLFLATMSLVCLSQHLGLLWIAIEATTLVSAPLITTGVVDLPSVGQAKRQPDKVIEIVVGADESLRVRVDGKDQPRTGLKELAARVNALQGGNVNTPVIIAADRNVPESHATRSRRTSSGSCALLA
jgi:hypothetical protein